MAFTNGLVDSLHPWFESDVGALLLFGGAKYRVADVKHGGPTSTAPIADIVLLHDESYRGFFCINADSS